MSFSLPGLEDPRCQASPWLCSFTPPSPQRPPSQMPHLGLADTLLGVIVRQLVTFVRHLVLRVPRWCRHCSPCTLIPHKPQAPRGQGMWPLPQGSHGRGCDLPPAPSRGAPIQEGLWVPTGSPPAHLTRCLHRQRPGGGRPSGEPSEAGALFPSTFARSPGAFGGWRRCRAPSLQMGR